MKTGLTTNVGNIDDYVLLKLYADAGFDCADYYFSVYEPGGAFFSSPAVNSENYFRELKNYADELGISFYQTHAPYPTQAYNGATAEEMRDAVIKSIAASRILGAGTVVVHPRMKKTDITASSRIISFDENALFYKSLEREAETSGVKVGLENMFGRIPGTRKIVPTIMSSAEELVEMLNRLNEKNFTVCYDIGHANILYKDKIVDIINMLGSRISCLHIHDNDGQQDLHIAPGYGTLNCVSVFSAIANIGFKGVYNLECSGTVKDILKSRNPENALKKLNNNFTSLIKRAVSAQKDNKMEDNNKIPQNGGNTEIKKYTPEELAEKRRKEREAAERRAKIEKDRYYSYYDDIKTPENPSW